MSDLASCRHLWFIEDSPGAGVVLEFLPWDGGYMMVATPYADPAPPGFAGRPAFGLPTLNHEAQLIVRDKDPEKGAGGLADELHWRFCALALGDVRGNLAESAALDAFTLAVPDEWATQWLPALWEHRRQAQGWLQRRSAEGGRTLVDW